MPDHNTSHEHALSLVASRSIHDERRWVEIRRVVDRVLPTGAIVELGVHRGGLIGYLATRLPDRIIVGYDTFERGTVGAQAIDGDIRDGILAADKAEVEAWLASIGANGNVQLMRCDVREVRTPPAPIALAFVDLNIYEPTLAALEWVRANAIQDAYVLIDDIGFAGVARAVDEFVTPRRLATIDHGYMLGIQL